MGVYLGLVEDDEFADGEGWDEPARDARPTARPPRARALRRRPLLARDASTTRAAARGGRDDLPRSATERLRRRHADHYPDPYADYQAASGYQITALHPRTYNEARTIGEAFRANTPVIMNLSEMDDADAKRLVDFAAGLTFGLHGRIERVTAKVFLLSPHNVTVTAQDKAKIENGFFNQS